MNILKFEFKKLLKGSIVWSLVSGALIVFIMSVYPSMQTNSMEAVLKAKMDSLPKGMMSAFGIDKMTDFTDISQYLAYSMQYIVMATGIYGLILGINSLIREESEGTIEFLYAKPISRKEIVTYKILANSLVLIMYTFILFLITSIISLIVKSDNTEIHTIILSLLKIFKGMIFVGLIFLFIGFFLSTILKNSRKSITVGIGIFFISYFIGMVSKLKENLKFLKYFSPSEFGDPSIMIKTGFDKYMLVIGLGLIIFSVFFTYVNYNKKDMLI